VAQERANKKEKPTTAADLLAEWRAAGRDTVAAQNAVAVSKRALEVADAAEQAARETHEAADAAKQAAERAREAAAQARRSASLAAESAQLAHASAQGDAARADQVLQAAEIAEATARARFNRVVDNDSGDSTVDPTS
jgi:chromosome segregation protein